MNQKYKNLCKLLEKMNKVLVAYSGGVDSTFLLYAAKEALGKNVLAVLIKGPHTITEDAECARDMAAKIGVAFIEIEMDMLNNPEFVINPANRCYICKYDVFQKLTEMAGEKEIPVVLHGETASDRGMDRPGKKAALEWNVRASLDDVGLLKEEIRLLSNEKGLMTWNHPSRSCLATRMDAGIRITKENLVLIEKAEAYVRSLGIGDCRVKIGENITRVEVRDKIEIAKLASYRCSISDQLGRLGLKNILIEIQRQ